MEKSIGVLKMVEFLSSLEPIYLFGGWMGNHQIIITSMEISDVKLPQGYHYNGDVITNGQEEIFVRKATKYR